MNTNECIPGFPIAPGGRALRKAPTASPWSRGTWHTKAWLAGLAGAAWLMYGIGCASAQSAAPAAPGTPPTNTTPAAANPPAARPASSLDEIKQLIGEAPCTSDSQCATLAVGAKSCGGPDYYLPWSRAHTDGAKLDAVARRYAEERKADNLRRGMNSNCLFIPDPGARCVRPKATAAQLPASATAAATPAAPAASGGNQDAKPSTEGRCQLNATTSGANPNLR